MKGKGCTIAGSIKFELSVVKAKEKKGGIRFLIAEADGNYTSESISKIKFEIIAIHGRNISNLPGLWQTEEK